MSLRINSPIFPFHFPFIYVFIHNLCMYSFPLTFFPKRLISVLSFYISVSLNKRTAFQLFEKTPSLLSSVSVVFALTLDEADIGLAPGVAMLGGEDADRLNVGLWGAADPLQLNAELISCQWSSITVVHVQHKELIPWGGKTRKPQSGYSLFVDNYRCATCYY